MKFEVETGRVSVTVTKLQEALNNVSENRKKMFDAIETLNGMWAGQAHDTYLAQVTADNAMAQSIVEEIQKLIDAVDTSRKSYDSCEQSVKETITAITI